MFSITSRFCLIRTAECPIFKPFYALFRANKKATIN
nr:MAG TPA: hypothetical protein [Bacteriophage sp.]